MFDNQYFVRVFTPPAPLKGRADWAASQSKTHYFSHFVLCIKYIRQYRGFSILYVFHILNYALSDRYARRVAALRFFRGNCPPFRCVRPGHTKQWLPSFPPVTGRITHQLIMYYFCLLTTLDYYSYHENPLPSCRTGALYRRSSRVHQPDGLF